MILYKTKKWPVFELFFFKVSMVLFGLLVGAYFADFVKNNFWPILIIAIAAHARVTYFYLFKKDPVQINLRNT